ncbi:MAG: YopX family protein [Cetobacterium sp.]|uniref:YopX family protein n=1 Tax=Cetobacterium sp. TaxID=2071632 RepID=UPI003EE5DA8B
MNYSFRAWDDLEGEMLDHMQFLHVQEHMGIKAKNPDFDVFEVRSLKIDACLGIEDSVGNTIYENDIISTGISTLDGYAYIVLRNPATAGYVCKPFKLGQYGKKEPRLYSVALPTLDQLKQYKIVVMGNKHQHPELLVKE